MIKNIGVFLGHPCHFHNMKNVVENLNRDGYNVFIAIKEKDMLEQLCIDAGYSYYKLREGRGNSKLAMVKSVLGMEYRMMKFIRKNKIELLVGSTLSFAAAVLARIPVLVMCEDDADAVPHYANIVYPFATKILSPECCDNSRWKKKSVYYPSYHELAYLHPNHFKADAAVVKRYGIDVDKPYFIIRFSALNAHHDAGIHGINTQIAERMIEMLKPHGRIYITSERPLEPQFEQYRIKINPLDMHHVMAFASLYVGDSQTMAAEAGVLGTPFVRFNDFVGRLSYLHELEAPSDMTPRSDGYVPKIDAHVNDSQHYGLGYGHKTADVEGFFASIERWLAMPDRKAICAERREKMLSEKVDYAKFMTWFIEEYPKSVVEAKQADKNFWEQFK